MNPLINKQCSPSSQHESALDLSRIEALRKHTPHWQFCATENQLSRTLQLRDFTQTMQVVNAIAEIAQAQDHHPEMHVSYKRCKINYFTHTVNGLTESDFICAALIDQAITSIDGLN